MTSRKVVIDTDCGVDDAEALMLALSSKTDCDILAITCVGGNTVLDNVTGNVLRILDVCRRPEIPVYRGSSCGLVTKQTSDSSFIHESDGFGGIAHTMPIDTNRIKPEHAANALNDLVKRHNGEVTLITLGPLTNIALCHRLYPDFASGVKELWIMGGTSEGRGNRKDLIAAEFNFGSDPESIDVVLREFKCPMTIVPWETCISNKLSANYLPHLFSANSIKADFLRRLLEKVQANRFKTSGKTDQYYSCDLMAMACALDHSCIDQKSTHFVGVETQGNLARGTTVHDWRGLTGRSPNATVVTTFNTEYMEKYLENIIM